jgi:hypothetical protein
MEASTTLVNRNFFLGGFSMRYILYNIRHCILIGMPCRAAGKVVNDEYHDLSKVSKKDTERKQSR